MRIVEVVERRPHAASRLGDAWAGGDTRALPFLGPFPPDLESAVREAAGEPRRTGLASAVEGDCRAWGAGEATRAAVARLDEPGAVAVVTGQQTAPCLGPLYTVLKAAGAILLARDLERRLARPVVPVFWAEGDDHDADEVSRVALGYDASGTRWLEVAWTAVGGPIGDLRPASWEAIRSSFLDLFPQSEFRDAAVLSLLAGTGPETTLGDWFCRSLLSVFAPWGLVVVHSRSPGLRLLRRDFAAGLVRRTPELTVAIDQISAGLEAAGFAPQARRAPGRAPFFVIRDGRRLPVAWDSGRLAVDGQKTDIDRLADDVAAGREDFSPGVLLRPLVQDHLLPTAVYVAGPAELSYLGQCRELRRLLGLRIPAAMPRPSLTILEPGRRRAVELMGVPASTFLSDPPEAIFGRLAEGAQECLDHDLWRRAEDETVAPITRLAGLLPRELASLGGAAEKTSSQMRHLLRAFRERVARGARSREEDLRRRVFDTAAAIRPGGAPMERTLSAWYFLAKYGPGFTGELMDVIDGAPAGHLVVTPER